MIDATSWRDLLAEFSALGGEATGVEPREQNGMRGLFPVSTPSQVKIRVPRGLLIPLADVCIKGSTLSLKATSKVSPAARSFFEKYNSITSWHGGGRQATERFLTEMQALPDAARSTLIDGIGLADWFHPMSDALVLEHFLRARALHVDGVQCVAPILEICNHANNGAQTKLTKGGLALEGEYSNEVLWQYAELDAFQMFAVFNFTDAMRYAYSIPFTITHNAEKLTIRVNNKPSFAAQQPDRLPVPIVKRTGQIIDLGFLLLGDRKNPQSAMLSFQRALAPMLGSFAMTFFEGMQNLNRTTFLKLLGTVESVESDVALEIRKACRFQLEALSSCRVSS